MSNIFRAEDQWTLARLGKSYQVNFIQTETQFTGHYIDVNNSSIFAGEVLTGQGRTLVHFVQSASSEYYAVHAGKLVRSDRIEGHWYDTAGNTGHFSLKCQPNLSAAIDQAKERAIASRELNNQNRSNPSDTDISTLEPTLTAGVICVEDIQRQEQSS